MTYSNYATKLNNETDNIKEILASISQIDLYASWEGNAAKKQINNIINIVNEKNIQLQNIDNLTSVLLLLDEYNNEKKLANEYQININNLNTQDKNYQQNKENLTSLKNKSINKYESIKNQIEEKLSNITIRYSEQYVDLSPTTVENTVNLFTESQNKLKDIDNHLTIKATRQNKETTSSANAGTIQLDKQGKYYDKEPTPGENAQRLHVYHNEQRLYDDACITIKKGETIRLTVNISDNAGRVQLLKRTTADGQENWREYLTGRSEPYVNRNDPNTYIPTNHYDWVITGDRVTNGYVILSQTAFHSTENAPEYKSMYRIKVRVVN